MTKDQLQRECDFAGAIAIADRLLANEYITKDEYIKIRRIFLKKYAPLIAGSTANPKSLT